MESLQKTDNFNMQDLMNITGQTAMNVNNLSQQMGVIASSVNSLRNDVNNITGRMEQIEQKEEITTDQCEAIKDKAYRRVFELIGSGPENQHKYFGTFIRRLYASLRKTAGLGSSISKTQKCNFQNCMNKIEAWEPDGGIRKLKEDIDKSAAARKKVREEGYIV